MRVDELAIVNRRQRWQITGEEANAVMILNLAAGWLTRLDSDFFACDYRVNGENMDAADNLRQLMHQLLVAGLVNHQSPLPLRGQPLAQRNRPAAGDPLYAAHRAQPAPRRRKLEPDELST